MNRYAPPQRRRRFAFIDRIGMRTATNLVVVILVVSASVIIALLIYQTLLHENEFVVVYREIESVEDTDVAGRTVERRLTTIEAVSEMTRLELVLPILAVQNLAILLGISFVALYRGQRISGPVYRMSSDIRKAISGERRVRIVLREGDELQELSQRINSLLTALDAADHVPGSP